MKKKIINHEKNRNQNCKISKVRIKGFFIVFFGVQISNIEEKVAIQNLNCHSCWRSLASCSPQQTENEK